MFSTIVSLWHRIVIIVKWFVWELSNKHSDSQACLVGKTAIVTGGSSGIGYATCVLLASRGCKVIIACRRDGTKEKDEIIKTTGNPNITVKKLDLMSLKSVRMFAEDIARTEDKIDILINNAGVGAMGTTVSEDGLNPVMQINYFGGFLLTHLLLKPLKSSRNARVVFVTSAVAALQTVSVDTLNMTDYDISYLETTKLYADSKVLNIFAAYEFAKRLKKYGITVNAADTGVADTPIYTEAIKEIPWISMRIVYKVLTILARTAFIAAQTSFHLASSEKLKNETGQLYFRCKRFHHYWILDDKEFCDKIWRKSEELVNLREEEKI